LQRKKEKERKVRKMEGMSEGGRREERRKFQ
jgi:hypothetical protein